MRNLLILIICLAFYACNNPNTERPNVIIILTDDQGYGDFSCHGNPILKTPNVDNLYNQSIRFTDFHVSSICTPTRSQLLTGQDACRNGAFAWAYSREIIHSNIPMMPEIFKENGYNTGQFGKWHLGDNYPYRPMDRGFDESVKHGGASIFQTPDYWDNDYQDDFFEHNGVMQQYKGYCTDVWFEETKKFIQKSKNDGKPFFVYLPTNTPHSPNIVHEKYSEKYRDTLNQGYEPVKEFAENKFHADGISWFYGMIANIDENIGKMDEFLKTNDLFENTIFIFMTDNGGTGGLRVFNAGMRGGKTSLYEGGHRVPFFIRWPNGNLSKPKNIDKLTHSQDILPTLIDLCNLKCDEQDFNGVSLKKLMTDADSELEERILVMQNAQSALPKKFDATVMWGKWRWIKNNELYNIKSDPAQQINIADKYPMVVEKMRAYYEQWWLSVQPSLENVPAFPVGGDKCEEVTLTCFDWHGIEGAGNVTVQPTIRKGQSANGYWNIEIVEDGEYEIRCSRWPAEAKTPIRAGLPKHETMTITYPEGKALPIASAQIKVGDASKSIKIENSDLFASERFILSKGKYKLKTTFFDKDGELVCGAYYTYLYKI
ncbi:arylsulfatase [Lutibacter citreus]|uniref:arylsulfatase n=1 Tax=Lutibacter citreus TaxID=2138210 RepID=UPI000DBE38D0|nr:arylsulfatase [Lutibacter citreus]